MRWALESLQLLGPPRGNDTLLVSWLRFYGAIPHRTATANSNTALCWDPPCVRWGPRHPVIRSRVTQHTVIQLYLLRETIDHQTATGQQTGQPARQGDLLFLFSKRSSTSKKVWGSDMEEALWLPETLRACFDGQISRSVSSFNSVAHRIERFL